jgi:hypothetical protein
MSEIENEHVVPEQVAEVQNVPQKKKRVMTEEMLQKLALAREKSQEARRAKGELTKKKTVLKKIKELEEVQKVDRKLEKRMKKLEPKEEEEDESDDEEVVYMKKPKKKPAKKPKKKIVYVSDSSDESESEEEQVEEKIVKKPSRKSLLREQELEKNNMALEQAKRQKEYEEAKQKHILHLVSRLGIR